MDPSSEIGLLYHLDTYAAINPCNLRVYQWLMTTHLQLVAEYIQYDDCNPFHPLQLQRVVNELSSA